MFKKYFTENGTKAEYQSGDVLVDCSSIPTHVFWLETGYVKASVTSPRGNEHVLIFYKPGEIFPARWAFTEIKGNAFYTAISPVTVFKVSKNEFNEYLLSHPQESLSAIQYTTMIMDVFVNRVNDMAHLTAYLRLVGNLLSMAGRFGKPHGNGVVFEIPVTQGDLASSVSMARETLSREMSKLEKKALISHVNQFIYIPDLQKMHDELNNCDY